MQTQSKKINVAALVFVLPLCAFAAPDQPAPAPAGAAPAAQPPAGDTSANTTHEILDYGFNHKAQQGTEVKTGNLVLQALADKINASSMLATPALDDAATGTRFKTYLGLSQVTDDQIKAYFTSMQQVTDDLKQNRTFPAWKILYSMGDYSDIDAGISRELAHRIEAIWNGNGVQNGLKLANDQEQDKLNTAIWNSDQTADQLHQQDLLENAKQGGRSGGGGGSSQNNSNTNSALINPSADPIQAEASMLPQMSGALQRKMELTDEYLQSLEARAAMKLNDMKAHKIDVQEQTDFASYIDTLFKSHRYYHVIIAADFYRNLFNQDEYPVNMQNEVNTALETNQQVTQGLEAFKFDAGQGRIAAASTELQNAYLANEFHPALQGLQRDEKQRVGDFITNLNILKNELEVRDFEEVPGKLDQLKKLATDFDATQPTALVNGTKLESTLLLGKAKLEAQQGALTDAMKTFEDAAEAWPGNPDLQTAQKTFFGTTDVVNQNTDEFDRAFKEGDFRKITDNAVQYGAAVHGDHTREQQLTDSVHKVQKAEAATAEANMRMMGGDFDGAWETIEAATKDWPEDVKLNQMLASLSARSADFVSAINKARDAESKKEYGYSLTWYVNALAAYPASTIANAGKDNVSKLILASGAEKGTVSAQD